MASSNYYEAYKARVSHLGANPQERALKSGILEFRRYLKYNEHTVRGLTKGQISFDGVILTDKQDENRVSQILLTDLETDLKVGELINWEEGIWLPYKKIQSSYQPYQKFYMVKCNYLLKWVDADGIVQSSWCYVTGSKDSKIKDNFRTWNSLITPQPNKFIEILMPYQLIAKSTEVIVNDEAWTLVDYDKVSVPEIIFMSFTESKINEIRDDLDIQLANVDKIATWVINVPSTITVEKVGTNNYGVFTPNYVIYKDGVEQSGVIPKLTLSSGLSKIINADGSYSIKVSNSGTITYDYENAHISQQINLSSSSIIAFTLEGNSKVRVGSKCEFVLKPSFASYSFESPAPMATLFNLVLGDEGYEADESSEVTICSISSSSASNKFVLNTNNKNKLGKVQLVVSYLGQSYSKNIDIIPIWG